MIYAPTAVAVMGALILGWIADLMTGRRGFGGTGLVAVVGAACGWFLAQRVFAIAAIQDWRWVGWALAGSVLSLAVFLIFRSKR